MWDIRNLANNMIQRTAYLLKTRLNLGNRLSQPGRLCDKFGGITARGFHLPNLLSRTIALSLKLLLARLERLSSVFEFGKFLHVESVTSRCQRVSYPFGVIAQKLWVEHFLPYCLLFKIDERPQRQRRHQAGTTIHWIRYSPGLFATARTQAGSRFLPKRQKT